MKIHPCETVLRSVLGPFGKRQLRILRHLKSCPQCQERLDAFRRTPFKVASIQSTKLVSYDAAFDRSRHVITEQAATLKEERGEAPLLFAELMKHTEEKREILLRDHRGFHTWGLFELLVERSQEASSRDPVGGEALGRLALRIADLLPTSRYGSGPVEDLRACAWGCIGNAQRIRADFSAAEEAFRTAEKHLDVGTGDLFEKAMLLGLKASLRRAQRLLTDSLRLLRYTGSIFQRLGDRTRTGSTLINVANVYRVSGNPERGVLLLQQALQWIDPKQEPTLTLCARHNLAFFLTECGRVMESQQIYSKIKNTYQVSLDSSTKLRQLWLEAKIAHGLGQRRRAESLFLTVREGFVADGLPYDAALASLELAALYAEMGRMAQLRRLSAEAIPIFRSKQVFREELAARLLASFGTRKSWSRAHSVYSGT